MWILAPPLQRKAVAWLQGPGRAGLASPETAAEQMRFKMETCIYTAASAAMDLLGRLPPSRQPGWADSQVGGQSRAGALRGVPGWDYSLLAACLGHLQVL